MGSVRIRSAAVLLGLFALSSLYLPASAFADEHGREERGHMEVRHEGPAFHGEIRHFSEHDWGVWRGGRWEHGYHGGRLGWWWIAGGLWYFYPAPIYPYPDPFVPPAVVVTPAAPAVPPPAPTPSSWYFCRSANGYYPYINACPEGWQQVPAR